MTVANDSQQSLSEIIPDFLYIGNKSDAESEAIREHHGIQRVLTLCPNVDISEMHLPPSSHLILAVPDNDSADLLSLFPTTFDFIDKAATDKVKILVHCDRGVSRGPCVVAAYLIKKQNLSAGGALDVIRKVRPRVDPSPHLVTQLDIYEISHDPSPSNHGYLKWRGKRAHKSTFSKPSILRHDTVVAFSDKILMKEPSKDPHVTNKLIKEMKVTHLIAAAKPESKRTFDFCAVDTSSSSISKAATYIHDAIHANGVVLIYVPEQSLSWTIACTYLMVNLKLHPIEAHTVLDLAKDVRV